MVICHFPGFTGLFAAMAGSESAVMARHNTRVRTFIFSLLEWVGYDEESIGEGENFPRVRGVTKGVTASPTPRSSSARSRS